MEEERISKLEKDVEKIKKYLVGLHYMNFNDDFDNAFKDLTNCLEKESLDTGISNNSKN